MGGIVTVCVTVCVVVVIVGVGVVVWGMLCLDSGRHKMFDDILDY